MVSYEFDDDSKPGITRGFGLVTYEKYENSCQPYYEGWDRFPDDLSAWHITAKAFGITALVLGLIGMILSWCVCCIACDMKFIKGLGFGYGSCALFQVLTMLFFGGDLCKENDCQFSSSAGVAIAATIFWIASAVFSFKMPPHHDDDEVLQAAGSSAVAPVTALPSPDQAQTVKVTETINEDGSKVVVKETINPDGSKLVETTVTEMAPV